VFKGTLLYLRLQHSASNGEDGQEMEFVWDPVIATNLLFCVIIVILGYLGYRKKHLTLPILVGVAFGLFGISHLLTLLSVKDAVVLIPIRGLAYLIVIFALAQFLRTQKGPSSARTS